MTLDNIQYEVKRHLKGDPVIWLVVLMMVMLSILVVYSATGALALKVNGGDTEYFLLKQTIYVCLSLTAMWVAHKIDYRHYAKIARISLVISLPLLLFSTFAGTDINSASRWISLPVVGLTFQPSDLAKFALITYMAVILSRKQQNIDNFKEAFLPVLFWCGTICCLIALTNLSTAVVLFATCLLLMFIGRVPLKYLMMLLLVGVLAGFIALSFGQRGETASSRMHSFFNEEKVPFQLEQSYIAIATGGVLGKGPGNSTQRNFLPHPYSDFIYAIIIEEYGFLGGGLVIFLFLVLLYRGMVTVAKSERAFGGLLSAGLAFSLVVQAFVNMGVAVGLGPVTGLPLPLLSMGGTSLLFTGISLGIILSVSRGDGKEEKYI